MPRAFAASIAILSYPAAGCTMSLSLCAALIASAPHRAVVGISTSLLATCSQLKLVTGAPSGILTWFVQGLVAASLLNAKPLTN